MHRNYTCYGCKKQGRNPDDIKVLRIDGHPYHPSCYLREKAKRLKPIICPNCHQEIKEGERTLTAVGCATRHADLNCHLKGK